jgi:hypothetical protein
MEELDLLKKAWQKDTHKYEQISESEIYKMLHTRSSSIVKWIMIISVIEFLFWIVISICYNTDEYMKKLHAEEMMVYFKVVNFINYAVILFFIYKFYKNYIKISATVSTQQLMQDILKARKTVKHYVYYNLAMITVSFIAGFIIAFCYNPQMEMLKYKITHEEDHMILFKTVGFLLLIIVVFLVICWIIYWLLYGILLRKLHRNYKELKKIDL